MKLSIHSSEMKQNKYQLAFLLAFLGFLLGLKQENTDLINVTAWCFELCVKQGLA